MNANGGTSIFAFRPERTIREQQRFSHMFSRAPENLHGGHERGRKSPDRSGQVVFSDRFISATFRCNEPEQAPPGFDGLSPMLAMAAAGASKQFNIRRLYVCGIFLGSCGCDCAHGNFQGFANISPYHVKLRSTSDRLLHNSLDTAILCYYVCIGMKVSTI